MPLFSPHPSYTAHASRWQKCYDFARGVFHVKEKGTVYLPKLPSHTPAEYLDYLLRTKFFAATARTVQGLIGCLFRKDAQIEDAPDKMADIVDDVNGKGQTFQSFAKDVCALALSMGRGGILIDASSVEANPQQAKPYVGVYTALDVLNWRVETVGGLKKLTFLVLTETAETLIDASDPFSRRTIPQWRVLSLRELTPGKYEYWQTVYQRASDIVALFPGRDLSTNGYNVKTGPTNAIQFPNAVLVNGQRVPTDLQGYTKISDFSRTGRYGTR